MKKIAFALTAVVAVFGFGASAVAQYTPSATPPASSPAPGGSFNVTIAGCPANSTATVMFNGMSTNTTTNATGGGTVSLTAPTTAGAAMGSVTCGGATTNFTVNVMAPTTSTPPTQGGDAGSGGGTLPATGSDGISTTTTMALGLLIVGGGLFVVAQARRKSVTA